MKTLIIESGATVPTAHMLALLATGRIENEAPIELKFYEPPKAQDFYDLGRKRRGKHNGRHAGAFGAKRT